MVFKQRPPLTCLLFDYFLMGCKYTIFSKEKEKEMPKNFNTHPGVFSRHRTYLSVYFPAPGTL